jgi:putative transposase
MGDTTVAAKEKGLLTLTDAAWSEAKRRADMIRPLADGAVVTRRAADSVAQQLGVSRRTVYAFVQRWRCGERMVTDLARRASSVGRSAGRSFSLTVWLA